MEEQEQITQQGGEENPIVAYGSSIIQTSRGTIHVLTIVGQVEGHQVLPPSSKSTKYEHVMPLLAMVEESEAIDGLLILLNTVGGDVEAGLGIAELIAGMSKPTVSLVLGGGHSIGVPLAVSAKRSFIAPSAAMTIHPVRLNGLVIGGYLYKADAANGGAGRRRGQRDLRRGGGGAGAHRRDRRAVLRPGVPARDDPGAKERGRAGQGRRETLNFCESFWKRWQRRRR